MTSTLLTTINVLFVAIIILVWGFELGPWNEAVRADVCFTVMGMGGSAVIVGLSVALVTLLIELASSLLVALYVVSDHAIPRKFMRFLNTKIKRVRKYKANTGFVYVKLMILGIGIGAAAVVLASYVYGRSGLRQLALISLACSACIAVFSGLIAYIIAVGVQNIANHSGQVDLANQIVSFGSNIIVWIVIFAALQLLEYGYNRYARSV